MASPDPVTAVVEVWKNNVTLCKSASMGIMTVVGKQNEITRREVCSNAAVVEPIIRHFGPLLNYFSDPFIFECWKHDPDLLIKG